MMDTRKKSIVCLSMTTWEGDYMKTIVHMMSQLAKDYKVLFVDYPFTYKDLAFSAFGKSTAPAGRMLGLKPRLRKLSVQGSVVNHLTLPPVLPTNWIGNFEMYRMVMASQSSIIAKSINNVLKELEMHNPIIINAFNPLIGVGLKGKLNEIANIYYCYDEIRAAQWCGKHGGKMEDILIDQSDAVVTTSTQLQATKSQLNSHTHLIKNGVDFSLFNQAYNTSRLTKVIKVVGYLGSIDFRLDYDLLTRIIASFPDYEFHFVGRISNEVGRSRLEKFDNVKFVGALQPNEIPGALSKFDIGLIPFVENEFTRNVYPLKINEYLAAGIPVVTTAFADLSDFSEMTTIVDKDDCFENAIRSELENDSVKKMAKRAEMASTNDWSKRAEQMKELIEELTTSHAS
ncbi:MAG: glycosyltransferase [Cyclobacteriaceae bacterium]